MPKFTKYEVPYYENSDAQFTFEVRMCNNTKTDGILYHSLDEISEALRMPKQTVLRFQKCNSKDDPQCTFSGKYIVIKKIKALAKDNEPIIDVPSPESLLEAKIKKMKHMTLCVLKYLLERPKNETVSYYKFNTGKPICIHTSLKKSDIETLYNIADVVLSDSFAELAQLEMKDKKLQNLVFNKYTETSWKNFYKFGQFRYQMLGEETYVPIVPIKVVETGTDNPISITSLIETLWGAHIDNFLDTFHTVIVANDSILF